MSRKGLAHLHRANSKESQGKLLDQKQPSHPVRVLQSNNVTDWFDLTVLQTVPFYYFPSATMPRTLIFNLYQYEIQQKNNRKRGPKSVLRSGSSVPRWETAAWAAMTTAGLAVKLVRVLL